MTRMRFVKLQLQRRKKKKKNLRIEDIRNADVSTLGI